MPTTDDSTSNRWLPRPDHQPRLLLATNESDAARAAEEWVQRLRWRQTPTVDVLTVAPPPPLASRLWLQTYRLGVRDALLISEETDLLNAQRIANTVGYRLQERGTAVRVWARRGQIPDEITAMSQSEAPDLVVLGHQHNSTHVFAWRSSVPEQVAAHADSGVLVANRPPDEPGPLPRSALLVVPNEPAGRQALRWLLWAGWLRQTTLTLGWRAGPDSRRDAVRQLADEAAASRVDEIDLQPGVQGLSNERVDPDAFDLVALAHAPTGPEAALGVKLATETRAAVLILPHP